MKVFAWQVCGVANTHSVTVEAYHPLLHHRVPVKFAQFLYDNMKHCISQLTTHHR